jgi:ABC-type nickel/cobalt efflux system permease component RcnA
VAQDLRQLGGAELAGSAGAVRERREPDPGPLVGLPVGHSPSPRRGVIHVNPAVALGTAFLLGLAHAIEVDHMIAVTAFVSTRPALRAAAGFGLRWGLGHSIAVFLAGGILIATGLRWPQQYDTLGEGLVGLLLVAVGVWAMSRARKLHLHPPEEHGDHAHLHAHRDAAAAHGHGHDTHPTPGHPPAGHHHHDSRHDRHGITGVGLMHGLAGTSAVVALVPVTLMDRWYVGLGYLVAFGLGTVVAMTAYAVVAAVALRRASEGSLKWGRLLGRFVGAGSIVVGGWWIWRAVA